MCKHRHNRRVKNDSLRRTPCRCAFLQNLLCIARTWDNFPRAQHHAKASRRDHKKRPLGPSALSPFGELERAKGGKKSVFTVLKPLTTHVVVDGLRSACVLLPSLLLRPRPSGSARRRGGLSMPLRFHDAVKGGQCIKWSTLVRR